jgi:hypothetical protein
MRKWAKNRRTGTARFPHSCFTVRPQEQCGVGAEDEWMSSHPELNAPKGAAVRPGSY